MGVPNTALHPHKDESTSNAKVNTVQKDSGHGTSIGALTGISFGCTALLAVILITTFLVSIAPSLVKKTKNQIRTILYSALKSRTKFTMLSVFCVKYLRNSSATA